jgi:hypothetical protein
LETKLRKIAECTNMLSTCFYYKNKKDGTNYKRHSR